MKYTGRVNLSPEVTGSMRDAFCEALLEAGERSKEVFVLTADQGKSVKPFARKYPDRFVDAGIAEANMLGIAAGLALCGKKPFVTLDWAPPASLTRKEYSAEEMTDVGPNLVTNSSFETWSKGFLRDGSFKTSSEGPDEFPEGWIGAALERVRKVEGKSGKYAVEMTKRDASHMLIDYVFPGGIDYIGKTIVFGVWCKLTPNSEGSLSVLYFIGNKHVVAGNKEECPKDNKWHFITASQTIPEKTEKILLRLNAYSLEPYEPIQFDDVTAVFEK